jgi:hypothetical protein
MKGEAADITTGTVAGNKRLYALIDRMAREGVIEFDQLIDESNFTWIHISFKRSGGNRRQRLKM